MNLSRTDFGKSVAKRLVDLNKTQKWLIDRIKEETGLFMDSSYLCKIMNGTNSSPKVIEAIERILSQEELIASPSAN